MTRPSESSPRAAGVLLVANYESDVGYAWWLMENFWARIAEGARAAGIPCVLAYPHVGTVPDVISEAPLDVVERCIGHRSLGEVWRGLQFIRQHRIAAIYLTDWPYLHWSYALWRLAGVRTIVIHDHTPGDRPAIQGPRAWLKGSLHALGVLSATWYVAVSHYIGTRMQANGRVPSARCLVVTNGIRPFAPGGTDRSAVRRRLGIPDDAVLVVMVSRATFYKGLDFGVRALGRALEGRTGGSPVVAVHCGDGPDLRAFSNVAKTLGLERQCRFLGRRNDVRDILCASDIAFHPSRGEAMSLAVLEFMCAELAVLTSDLPSVRTALREDETGLTYRAGDLESAARQLRRLFDDEPLRRRLGRAAGVACRQNYSLDATNAAFCRDVVPALVSGAAAA